jgi:lysozyme family protein
MADFERAFTKTLALEGGYANDPDDAGGETMYGITEATARNYGYTGKMKDLPLSFAKEVYRKGYWRNLDNINSQRLAEFVFDCGVNCGVGTAVKFLQRALNVLNNRGTLWPDLVVDGKIGPATINAANVATRKGYMEKALLKLYNVIRGYYYVTICEKREANEKFALGWILHRLLEEDG